MKNSIKCFFVATCLIVGASPAFTQVNSYRIENALMDLESEANAVSSGEIPGISDELLDFLYENYVLIPELYPTEDPSQALEILIPPYNQLNVMIQAEGNAVSPAVNVRLAKLITIFGSLSPYVMQNSQLFTDSLDSDSPDYEVRQSGLNQGLVGSANFLLGVAYTYFTQSQASDVQEILRTGLMSFGPDILNELPDTYRSQAVNFIEQNIAPAVTKESAADYSFFLGLISVQ